MRAVIQRVSEASVTVDGDVVGSCGRGLLILLGVGEGDGEAEVEQLWAKAFKMRIFPDGTHHTGASLSDVNGEALIVSQFTLYADCRKGNRPSFTGAGAPDESARLYELFVKRARRDVAHVECGKFGADMQVSLVNDGPFTICLDTEELKRPRKRREGGQAKSSPAKTSSCTHDIAGVLVKAAHDVRERRDAFLNAPGDIETLHKLRVSIRTLRSLVAFVAPWQKRTQNDRVQADLKALVSPTSRLRELDVLAEQAASMEGASQEFAAFCAETASRERRKVLKTLSSKKARRRLKRVVNQLEHIEWRAPVREGDLQPSEVRARFDALAEKLERNLASLDLADAEATHDVRKDAKRVRYDAERFGFFIGEDTVGIAKNMVAHQDDLGAICDARANIAITRALASENLTETVANDVAAFRQRNEDFLLRVLSSIGNPPIEERD